jgi:hypothetical protein
MFHSLIRSHAAVGVSCRCMLCSKCVPSVQFNQFFSELVISFLSSSYYLSIFSYSFAILSHFINFFCLYLILTLIHHFSSLLSYLFPFISLLFPFNKTLFILFIVISMGSRRNFEVHKWLVTVIREAFLEENACQTLG